MGLAFVGLARDRRMACWSERIPVRFAAVLVAGSLVVVASVSDSLAAGAEGRPVFVPITPCRLFDTRAADPVGPRAISIGPGDTHVQLVVGTNGRCSLPTGISAVAMNVTTINGTSASFLTVWPSDASRPLASSLNWLPGSPPSPNKVDVKLSAAGSVSFFNDVGSVDVLADVVGYYVDHSHDGRYPLRSAVAPLLPTTGSVTVSGTELIPRFSDTVRETQGGCAYITSFIVSLEMEASLPLPAGARLTRIDAVVKDSSEPLDLEFDLVRRSVPGFVVLATGFSSGSTGTKTIISAPIANEVVDHDEYFYAYVRPGPTVQGTDHQVCGFEIFYDIPAIAPAPSRDHNVFHSVNPCRLFDTRQESTIGARAVPLTAGEEVVEPVTGAHGNCDVPSDAAAVSLNVTTLNGTAASFLTIWPADVPRPLASSLNWDAGSPPTPNKVDVKLSADGMLKFYDNVGTVDVLADVVGYYAPHDHDDRYITTAELRSHQLLIGGSVVVGYPAFRPEGTTRGSTSLGCGYLQQGLPSDSTVFSASAPFPVGSTITAVRALIHDTATNRDAAIELRRDTGAARTILATATTTGLPSGDHVVQATLATPEVIGSDETFTISVDVGVSTTYLTGAGVGVCGAEILVDPPAYALPSNVASTGVFVPFTPCRLFDTRPAEQVGLRRTALSAGDIHVQDVVGTNGNCDVPIGTTAVAMNVTSVNGTAPSFLTIWPSDVERPLASSLNWVPGEPPRPNKVDVKVSAAGRVSFYNDAGSVDVLADVVGYYTNHDHDARYPQQPDATVLTAKRHSFTISGAAFYPSRSGLVIDWSGGCLHPGATSNNLFASVPIPAGATIERVRMTVIDANPAGGFVVGLVVASSGNDVNAGFTANPVSSGRQLLDVIPPAGTKAAPGKQFTLLASVSAVGNLAVCGAEVIYSDP
jgi:hypothetical protein